MHSSAHPENSFWTSGEAPGKEIALKTENSNLVFAQRVGGKHRSVIASY